MHLARLLCLARRLSEQVRLPARAFLRRLWEPQHLVVKAIPVLNHDLMLQGFRRHLLDVAGPEDGVVVLQGADDHKHPVLVGLLFADNARSAPEPRLKRLSERRPHGIHKIGQNF